MNSNRGQYNASPMYNMKNRRPDKRTDGQTPGGEVAGVQPTRRHGLLSVVLAIVLPVLFLLALLLSNDMLRWAFLGLAAVSVLAMWLLRAFVRSARNTLTVIYVALAAVIALALFINRQAPETRIASTSAASQASLFSNQDVGSLNAMLNELNTPAPTEDPEAAPAYSEAQRRLDAFFAAWGQNSIPEMKDYCLPSWVNEQQSAETVLFQMTRRSTPLSYLVEALTGSDGDSSRIITVKATFNENGETLVKRMQVIMKKVNDIWYVDPNSLGGVVVDEAAEAAAAANENLPHSTITPAPENTPESSGLIVYYNESGGRYYHLDKTCPSVSSEYWPLTGKIPFELINSAQYSKLMPCERCGAPARPAVGQQ